jgi:hypothetical protein
MHGDNFIPQFWASQQAPFRSDLSFACVELFLQCEQPLALVDQIAEADAGH